MHGVGPSTVLGGRYAVQRRLEQMPHAERWSAHDATLERDVVVICFLEGDPHAAAALDAARRAAGIDNHRLVRVLDVGRSEGVAFFVEEAIHDAHTLTQILGQGGVPAEEARRIAGETATALEASRARGLHHLVLTPTSILRSSDGTIKVRGIATAAALAGVDEVESTQASRIDAVGTVAIAYAALTSRWPLPGVVPGVEPAPHLVGGVPAPSEIAAGVPGDLDALCRLTLNDDEGPTTPGDFATQIAPWSTTAVEGLGSQPPRDEGLEKTIALPVEGLRPAQPSRVRPAPRSPIPDPASAPTDHTAASAVAAAGALGAAAGLPATGPAPTAPATPSGPAPTGWPTRPVPSGTPSAATRADVPQAGSTASGAGVPVRPVDDTVQTPTTPLARPGSPGTPAAGAQGPAVPPVADPGTTDDGEGGAGAGAAAGAAAAAATAAVGSALGTAGHAAGQAAGAAAHRVGSFARAQADKAAERRELRREAEQRAEQRRISLGQALVEGDELVEPPLPMLPQETAEPPSRDQSKLVLLIMATFLVVALVIGFAGASRIGSGTNLDLGGPPAKNTVTVTAPPTTVGPGDGTTAPGANADGFPVLSATGFDPEGDNAERNGEAARTFDGNAKTFWSSEGYASTNLGGLKKGVGVALDLGQVRKVAEVELVLPDPSDLTVYAAGKRSLAGADEIGASKGKDGTLTVSAAGGPVEAQYIIVWFTKVSQVSDGRFRATLAEVQVR